VLMDKGSIILGGFAFHDVSLSVSPTLCLLVKKATILVFD